MRYKRVSIEALGYELPPNVIASRDLENRLAPVYERLRLKRGQLEVMTGVYERRFWDPGFRVSDGAVRAGKKALARSRIGNNEIGMLIFAGVCRDNLEPATACAVADALGIGPDAQIFDVSNACLGMLNGMVLIADAIELGHIRAGLVVSCESAREIVDITIDRLLHDRDMALFKETVATLTGGSGAAAVLLTRTSGTGHRLVGQTVRAAARFHRLCLWGPDAGCAVNGTPVMKTDSVAVLKNGVALGSETFQRFMGEIGWPADAPDKIICHQAGASHQKSILDSIGISMEKDFTTFSYLGNIGTVSLPITAAIASERGFLNPGDRVGFFGIGSGLNCMMLGIEW